MRVLRNLVEKDSWRDLLRADPKAAPAPHVPQGRDWDAIGRRWAVTGASNELQEALLPETSAGLGDAPSLIENFIGHVTVPVGLAGPLRVNGSEARGDFYVPLATIEPTLVATYNRGAQTISLAGGCTTVLLDEGVIRSPGFQFKTLAESVHFSAWVSDHHEEIQAIAESTTRFGKLLDLKVHVTGRYVHLIFEFSTGDAIGQNMVTMAVDAVLRHLRGHCPVTPVFFTLDANMSGDKKPSMQTFQSVRGRKVSADVVIPRELCEKRLNTSPESIKKYNDISYVGGLSSGTLGIQGHYANGLTALYLACGQDTACAAESGVGMTFFDVTEEGDLYASVTLPQIMVGTVGAVSKLPSQRACLELLGLHGVGGAAKLAELAAALCLAGDLSMCAALSVDEFAGAHRRLARGQHAASPLVAVAS
jgi:hydroxymethylglutaryl-CoA reductase (NADPH)